MFLSSLKSVSGPMASTTTLEYGPKISQSHVTMKGGGEGPDPFIVKDYEKGPFFQPHLSQIVSNVKFVKDVKI